MRAISNHGPRLIRVEKSGRAVTENRADRRKEEDGPERSTKPDRSRDDGLTGARTARDERRETTQTKRRAGDAAKARKVAAKICKRGSKDEEERGRDT